MCGIVGLISKSTDLKTSTRNQVIFEQLLAADTFRGDHSTGVFAVDRVDGTVDYFKKAVSGWDFLDFRRTGSLMNTIPERAFVVGHNRWATHGKVNDRNAHPFLHGHIIGVHNGTTPKSDFTKGRSFEVDSDALFNHLSEFGSEDTLQNISGAFALVWYNSITESLHIIRNSRRPLTFAKSNSGEIFFASEYLMLNWILDRNGVKDTTYFDAEVGVEYVFPLSDPYDFQEVERELYTFQYSNWSYSNTKNRTTLETLGFVKGEIVDVEPMIFEPYANNSTGTVECLQLEPPHLSVVVHNIKKDDFKAWEGKPMRAVVQGINTSKNGEVRLFAQADFSKRPSRNILHLPQMVKGPFKPITEQAYQELTKEGCINCACSLPIDKAEDTEWFGGQPLCPDCSGEFIKA